MPKEERTARWQQDFAAVTKPAGGNWAQAFLAQLTM